VLLLFARDGCHRGALVRHVGDKAFRAQALQGLAQHGAAYAQHFAKIALNQFGTRFQAALQDGGAELVSDLLAQRAAFSSNLQVKRVFHEALSMGRTRNYRGTICLYSTRPYNNIVRQSYYKL